MIPEADVYRAANRLVAQYGAEALTEVNRFICDAIDRKDQERALLMLRIRLAIKVLQAPSAGLLH